MYLLNGESKHCIEFSDRGFQYGDGLFETIEILNGKPLFLKQHLQRLVHGCHKLLIPPPEISILSEEAIRVSQNSDKAVLKLMVTRGSGGRGYRQPDNIQPTRLFSLHPFPDYPEIFRRQGITAMFCDTRLGLNPTLAGIKHMNRLEQVMARSEWNSDKIQEGLMLDINENVIEGTMSNVFIVKNNVLSTPALELCGVTGVIRNIVIQLANNHQIPFIEKTLSQEDINSADELFITNSIIEIWPIKQIANRQYKVGSLTKQLQALFIAFKQLEINNG